MKKDLDTKFSAIRLDDGIVIKVPNLLKGQFIKSLSAIVGSPLVVDEEAKKRPKDFLIPVEDMISLEKKILPVRQSM